jgi:DNA-directed RNA polymerase subunit beta
VDASRIEVGDDVYSLRKYEALNERTCQNQTPIVSPDRRSRPAK